jgi:tRNA nucleotidyltransferase (CCA-adding enzyme)
MIDPIMAQEAREIVRQLTEQGYEAYLVGGCVRDMLLGRPVQDVDIATSATPDEVMAAFPRTVPTGLDHGTVTVIMPHHAFEVTTFRRESEYAQYRRPEKVEFISDLTEDLRRRDFTFNAMAMDGNMQLIDPFGGRKDLAERRVRCVGNADERFSEDALRMLRCIRFAGELDCRIAMSTWKALCRHRDKLRYIAMERVRAEVEKIVQGQHPDRGIRLLARSRLLQFTKADLDLPENCAMPGGLGEFTQPLWRWTALFRMLNICEQAARDMMRKLTFSRKRENEVGKQLRFHEYWEAYLIQAAEERHSWNRVRDAWKLAVIDFSKDILSGWLAIIHSTQAPLAEKAVFEKAGAVLETVKREGRKWLNEVAVETLRDLRITGKDLSRFGAPGPWVGEILHTLLREAALDTLENTPDALIKRARQEIERLRQEHIGNYEPNSSADH